MHVRACTNSDTIAARFLSPLSLQAAAQAEMLGVIEAFLDDTQSSMTSLQSAIEVQDGGAGTDTAAPGEFDACVRVRVRVCECACACMRMALYPL